MSQIGKLFSQTNPNEAIFQIEEQEGSQILEGDTGAASIGDATNEHIQNLSGFERQAWDEFIVMPDGNLFAVRPSPWWTDPDEYNLADKTEKEMFLKRNRVPEEYRELYDDDILMKLEKEMSEDILVRQRDHLVSYDSWEQFPQQWERWDVPNTPKPWTPYAGNSKKPFYDVFSNNHEPHFLEGTILSIINVMDKFRWENIMTRRQIFEFNSSNLDIQIVQAEPDQWIKIDGEEVKKKRVTKEFIFLHGEDEILHAELFCEYIRRRIVRHNQQGEKPRFSSIELHQRNHAYEKLKQMVLDIADGNQGYPTDIAEKALKEIDDLDFEIYKKRAAWQTKKEDPLYTYLCVYGPKLLERAEEEPYVVYNEIKRFSQVMYNDGFLAERLLTRRKINGRWVKLPKPKKVTEPQVAKKRHWAKYHELKAQIEKVIDRKKRVIHSKNPIVIKAISRLREKAMEAINTRNLEIFTKCSRQIILMSKDPKFNLSEEDVKAIWDKYNEGRKWILNNLSK